MPIFTRTLGVIMRRFLPYFLLLISCSNNQETAESQNDESVDCKKELSNVFEQTEFLNFDGEILKISEYKPTWLPNYTDSTELETGLFLQIKSDTIFNINISCGKRNDNSCRHAIYALPKLRGYDYINFWEYSLGNISFLEECGYDIHHHMHETPISKSYMSSSEAHGSWVLDSASTEEPPFNRISTRGTINGLIKSDNTENGFKWIDLPYEQKGTALNHQDSSDFILHCLIAWNGKLVLEDRKNPSEPIQYYFSAK